MVKEPVSLGYTRLAKIRTQLINLKPIIVHDEIIVWLRAVRILSDALKQKSGGTWFRLLCLRTLKSGIAYLRRFRTRAGESTEDAEVRGLEGSGTGVVKTLKLSMRSVPPVATVPSLMAVVLMSVIRK